MYDQTDRTRANIKNKPIIVKLSRFCDSPKIWRHTVPEQQAENNNRAELLKQLAL